MEDEFKDKVSLKFFKIELVVCLEFGYFYILVLFVLELLNRLVVFGFIEFFKLFRFFVLLLLEDKNLRMGFFWLLFLGIWDVVLRICDKNEKEFNIKNFLF